MSEQNFSGALATWKGALPLVLGVRCAGSLLTTLIEINLSELQKTLDSQGIELVENQKESVVGRKALADRTKGVYYYLTTALSRLNRKLCIEFKKISDEEKLNAWKGLLKCMYFLFDICVHPLP